LLKEVFLALVPSLLAFLSLTPKEDWHWFAEYSVNFCLGILFCLSLVKSLSSFWLFSIAFALCVQLNSVWLLDTIQKFGNFSFAVSVIIWALYFILNLGSSSLFFLFYRCLKDLRFGVLAFPAAWVVWENLPLQFFPWKLGYCFFSEKYISPIVSILGTSGLTFILSLASSILLSKTRFKIPICIGLLATTALPLDVFQPQKQLKGEVRAGLIQPNHSIDFKHNLQRLNEVILDLNLLSEKVLNADLIIWPESAINDLIFAGINHIDEDRYLRKLSFAKPTLLGVLTQDEFGKIYNSVIALGNDGEIKGLYHKQILTPFGEYIPFKNYLPFLTVLNPIEDFSPGLKSELLEVLGVRVGVLICYEDLFPELSLRYAKQDADFILVVANDLWFGLNYAPYLHDRFARFRARETLVPFVRVTNSGVSSVSDMYGATEVKLKRNAKLAQATSIKIYSSGQSIFTKQGSEVLRYFVNISLLLIAMNLTFKTIKLGVRLKR